MTKKETNKHAMLAQQQQQNDLIFLHPRLFITAKQEKRRKMNEKSRRKAIYLTLVLYMRMRRI